MVYLFGFSGAGSGPNVFKNWDDLLGDEIIFRQISLNTGLKKSDSYCDRMEEAAALCAEQVLPLSGNENRIYFFGHCMGANVAYETASLLAREYGISIHGLIFSAATSPDVPILDGISDRDDAAFADEIHSHGTFPEEFFVNPSLLRLFLPKIRADYRLLESYCDTAHYVLDCPIAGFFGKDDETIPPADRAGWAQYTTGSFFSLVFPGNHYFYYSSQEEIISWIRILIGKYENKGS